MIVCALLVAARSNAAIPAAEREALIAIYQSTNGAAWTTKTNWLGAAGSECTWYGVTCQETQTNVVSLELYENNLDGSIPATIRNLTKLRDLQVYGNKLRGALPAEIGELADLEAFFAQNNGFIGAIPARFGNLKNLQVLALDSNALSGPLPAQLGDITSLRELTLSSNAISGPLPADLGKLADLQTFEANDNQLSGTIPQALASHGTLTILGLAGNQLTGPIPDFSKAVALRILRLGHNQLTGAIPATLGNLHALESLDLRDSGLTGVVPSAIEGWTSIKLLDLAANDFNGPLPSALFGLTQLEELDLGENQLSGTLSPQIGNLANLQRLRLYFNQFTGQIPSEIANLVHLRELSLEENDFSGALPAALSQLSELTDLVVYGNDLSGPVPPQLGTLSKLETLHLAANRFEGSIPPQLGQLENLRVLALNGNRLTGAIPDQLRNLTRLEQFSAQENAIGGEIPDWIGEWRELTDLFLSVNQLTGPLPSGLSTLEKLAFLDLAQNQLSGPLIDFTRMGNLQYLTLHGNELSGPLPASIGALTKVNYFALGSNNFSGPIPASIGNLVSVEYFDLSDNAFEGAIPPTMGNLKKAYNISLWGNRLTGTIPPEIGGLSGIQFIDFSFNALRGPIPSEITRLTTLFDHGSNFGYNAFFTNDSKTRTFVNLKQSDGDFEGTQTVTPTRVQLVSTTDRSATLSWEPILYNYDRGGYQVAASTTPTGAPVAIATTSSKSLSSITVRNLAANTNYFFTVSAVTHPTSYQENLLISDRSGVVQGSTKTRVVAPPEVVLTDAPNGMVQIDRVEVEDDSFTVTNFGDLPTQITLERSEDFFTVSPVAFTLAAGGSQVVTLRSSPRDVGTFYGTVAIQGVGAPDDLFAEVVLLSSARPPGRVVATPITTRIELGGLPGSDEVGTAQFRNSGTARLTGIVLSDQPWVEVSPEPLTIDPGGVGAVNFTIVRAKRRGSAEGGLIASLTLVYVTGNESVTNISTHDTSSVSVSKVTIVDVTKPPVSTGPLPPLGPGEIPLFVTGLLASASQQSDLSIINAAGTAAISDLKLCFTQGAVTSIASLQPLGFSQTVLLPNLVNSIYGNTSSIGTLQIRSGSWGSLATEAKVTAIAPNGTYSGSVPVYRGDRAALASERSYLVGLSSPGDIFVQETSGQPAVARIDFRDASGNSLGTSNHPATAYGFIHLANVIPAAAKTAIIENLGPGLITAYARLRDANGDTWSVVDWSRFYDFTLQEAVRIPFADGAQGSSKRRAVRATALRPQTDLTLYNPTSAEARASLQTIDGAGTAKEQTLNIPAGATLTVANAASTSATPVAHVVVTPLQGNVVVSARSHHPSGGSAIPILSAAAGLRLGQTQIFSGLDDSTATRTSYGLTESSGQMAKVRVSIIIDETNPLTATVTSKTFTLGAGEQVFLPELVRSFAGNNRDALFGDLHNLTLEFEVVEGDGAVVPFVMTTDLASGDSNIVVQ